ncbi:pyridoxamine 5'-phosphate oxidase family protein [Oscillospiraceae bacterium WX1]
MRKADREIKDFNDIIGVLDRCQTIRLGLNGDEYPYVVPLSFGYEAADGAVTLYFHGATEGLKHELILKNNKVCVEADIFYRYTGTGHGITTEYESVIGFGTIHKADTVEAIKGLELLLNHCRAGSASASDCVALGITAVYGIELERITGKRRFVEAGGQE